MSGRKSRRKGVRGEQEVARKIFQVVFGQTPPPDRDIFVRTKIGVRQREGDIVVPKDFPLTFEVKNRPNPLTSVVNFTSPFSKLVEEVKGKGGERDVCLVTKIGHKSPFYYFVVTKDPSRYSRSGRWVASVDDWTIIWYSEREFFEVLRRLTNKGE